MARYCFYCGRELDSDEKCTCRTTGTSTGSSANPGSARTAPPPPPSSPPPKSSTPPPKAKPSSPPKSKKPGFFQSLLGFFAGPAKPPKRPGPSASKAPGKPGSPVVFLRTRLTEAGGFFTRPASTIRRVAAGRSLGVPVFFVLLQAVVSAGAALALSGKATMEGFLAFLLTGGIGRTSAATDLAAGGALVAPFVFASVVVQALVLAGILALALRFLLRTPVPFVRVFSALGPPAFYGTVLTLLALLSSLGATIPATHLLLAGLVLGFIALFVGLQPATGQSEDRLLMLLVFSLFLYYAFLSLLSGMLVLAFPAAVVPSGTGGAF